MPIIKPLQQFNDSDGQINQEIFEYWVEREFDSWIENGLEEATFEELITPIVTYYQSKPNRPKRSIRPNFIIHEAKTAEQTNRIFERMREDKGSSLTQDDINPRDSYGWATLHHSKNAKQTLAIFAAMIQGVGGNSLTLGMFNIRSHLNSTPLLESKDANQALLTLEIMRGIKGLDLTVSDLQHSLIGLDAVHSFAATTDTDLSASLSLIPQQYPNKQIVLMCAISLAKIREGVASEQETTAESALQNLEKNYYLFADLPMDQLKLIDSIPEFNKVFTNKIAGAVVVKKTNAIQANFIALMESVLPRVGYDIASGFLERNRMFDEKDELPRLLNDEFTKPCNRFANKVLAERMRGTTGSARPTGEQGSDAECAVGNTHAAALAARQSSKINEAGMV